MQTENGENPDWAFGIATNSELGEDTTTFMTYKLSTQLLEAALICCSKGDTTAAIEWIGKRIDTNTLAPLIPQSERGRLEAVNVLTRAMLKSPDRDMKTIFEHFRVGIEGARKLQSENRFKEAIANFRALEVAFPWEKKMLAELRPLTIHWDANKQLPSG